MSRPAPRRATLQDVASAAGVSRSTASRVLAGYGAASDAARARVTLAAERLGYSPDRVARALVTRRGFRLVVAVGGVAPDVLHDPYVDRVVRSAAEVCAPQGVGVSLQWLPLHAPEQVRQMADDRTVLGLLMVNTTEQALEAVPAALRGRVASIGIGSRTVPSFDVDNAGATTEIVQHLYAAGRRRLAMVTGPRWLPCIWRAVEAYGGLLRAAGLPIRLVPGDFTAEGGRAAMVEVLRRWPDTDAVLAGNDAMAFGALAVLRERGIDVPGDVAVTGFDDIPFASLTAPALTTASHPVDHIAAAAATAILNEAPSPPVTMYPSEVVLRQSA